MEISIVLLVFFLLGMPRIAGANNFGQTAVMSHCPQGSPRAEELYQEARKYWFGQEGYPRKPERAEELFEEAMFMGNSKAPLGIGGIYQWNYKGLYQDDRRLEFMLKMYNIGVKMGCAEGHVLLAECYSSGIGVSIDYKKALEELKQGVEKGSPKAMEFLGYHFVHRTGQIEMGRELLRNSISLGNGDAGESLSYSYIGNYDNDRVYAALRMGAKQGSMNCLRTLASYYLNGEFGQQKNEQLYKCITKIKGSINWFYAPRPIENFDALCPHPTPLDVMP
jgi:TPR repeat protein